MSDFVILSDSGCDFTKDLRERFGLDDYVPGTVMFPDGHFEYADLDWGTVTSEEYFDSMARTRFVYGSSLPSVGEVVEVYEKYLAEGKDIFAVTISSAISGTFNSFRLAVEEVKDKYPNNKIYIVDSLRYSSAIGIHVAMANELRKQGKSAADAAAWSEANKHRIHQMGPLDDLFFCQRKGRISMGKAIAGSLVGVRPLADFDRDGQNHVIGKARGRVKAIRATIEYMRNTIEDPEDQIIFVAHSNREDCAKELAELIKKEFSPKDVVVHSIGMSCGTGVGPGLTAAFYIGKEISEDMSAEAAILAAAVK